MTADMATEPCDTAEQEQILVPPATSSRLVQRIIQGRHVEYELRPVTTVKTTGDLL